MDYRCPVCGKPIEYRQELHGLCEDCYSKIYSQKITFRKKELIVTIIYCPLCGRIKFGKNWYKPNGDILMRVIKQQLKRDKNLRGFEYSINFTGSDFRNLIAENKIEKTLELFKNGVKMREFDFEIRLQKKICPLCMRKREGHYFEYVIHVRFQKKNRHLMQTLVNRINKIAEESRSFETVDIKKTSQGLDIRVSSRKLGEKISDMISSQAVFKHEFYEKRYDKGLQKQINVKKVLIEI